MDKNLIIKLVSIQSSYTEDANINKFIEDYVSKIEGVSVSKDTYGNVYAVKGPGKSGYKCIVSHTDTVHQIQQDRKVFIYDDVLFTMKKTKSYTYDSTTVSQTGTGGDDRSGIYTCIKALEDFNDIKAVFFRFEESGFKGSSASNIKFFDDCNFIIQCDRKGNSDFITHTNGIDVASSEFVSTMRPLYLKRGYSTSTGVATDIGVLKRNGVKVSCVNLSAGYFDPHSSSETINLTDLDNCYGLVSDMFTQHGNTRFEHTYTPREYATYSSHPSKSNELPFTFSLDRNYFANKLTILIDEIEKGNDISFINIAGTKKYKLLFDICLYYDENIVCPICKEKDEIIYYSDVAMFYCNAKKHSEFIQDDSMYRNCIIEDKSNTYVYDRLYDTWYKQEDAVYNIILNTYQLKEELIY